MIVYEELAKTLSYLDRFKEQQNKVKHPDCTTIDSEGKLPLEIIVPLILIVVVLCFGISMLFLWIYRNKIEKLNTGK